MPAGSFPLDHRNMVDLTHVITVIIIIVNYNKYNDTVMILLIDE
jgi:hypothetical protein